MKVEYECGGCGGLLAAKAIYIKYGGDIGVKIMECENCQYIQDHCYNNAKENARDYRRELKAALKELGEAKARIAEVEDERDAARGMLSQVENTIRILSDQNDRLIKS